MAALPMDEGVGMGLDEKAVEAVRQYRFRPAMKDGKPVKVDVSIDVNFQIFLESCGGAEKQIPPLRSG